MRWLNIIGDRALYIDCGLDVFDRPKGTKTGAARVVLLPHKAQSLLSEWHDIATCKEADDFIFSAEKGKPHNQNWFSRTLRGAIQRAGLEVAGRYLVVHSFRHTFVSMMRNVTPDEIAQAMSGHTTVRMLDVYTHRTAADLLSRVEPARDAVERLWAEEPPKDKPQKLTPGGQR